MNTPASHRRSAGFTLIELLVVIAIIAILAAILVPSFAGAQKRPHDVASLQCGKAIVTAQVTYEAEHNGAAATGLSQLNNSDVTEQCNGQGVQVSEDWFGASQGSAGDSGIGVGGSNYAFKVWHNAGSGIYIYNRDANVRFQKAN